MKYKSSLSIHRITGSMEFFEPARKLYEKFGFKYCAPFAPTARIRVLRRLLPLHKRPASRCRKRQGRCGRKNPRPLPDRGELWRGWHLHRDLHSRGQGSVFRAHLQELHHRVPVDQAGPGQPDHYRRTRRLRKPSILSVKHFCLDSGF